MDAASDRLEQLFAEARAAYLAFAAVDRQHDPGDAYDQLRAAWDRFASLLAAIDAVVAEHGNELSPWLLAAAREAEAGFRDRALYGPVDDELLAAAILAQLIAPLASRSLGEIEPEVEVRTRREFLRGLARRPHGLLAEWALLAGERQRAADLARLSSWDDPADLRVRIEALLACAELGEAETALARLAERAPAHPALPTLAVETALASAREHTRRREFGPAIGSLRAALERWPDEGRIQLQLGLTLRDSGHPAAALQHLAAAYGSHPAVLVEIGRTRLRMLDLAAARAFFTAAAEDSRTMAQAQLAQAEVCRLEGRAAAALAILDALPGAAHELDRMLERAAAFLDLGKLEPALALLRRGIDDGRERVKVLTLMARAQRLKGRLDDAQEAIRIALTEPGAGFAVLLEQGLNRVAASPSTTPFADGAPAELLGSQDFFAVSSFRPADAHASRRFLREWLADLRAIGIPIADGEENEYNRVLLHLERDLPQPEGAETLSSVLVH